MSVSGHYLLLFHLVFLLQLLQLPLPFCFLRDEKHILFLFSFSLPWVGHNLVLTLSQINNTQMSPSPMISGSLSAATVFWRGSLVGKSNFKATRGLFFQGLLGFCDPWLLQPFGWYLRYFSIFSCWDCITGEYELPWWIWTSTLKWEHYSGQETYCIPISNRHNGIDEATWVVADWGAGPVV